MIMQALRYWHTLRHLRPIQLGARLWRVVPRRLPAQGAALERRNVSGTWLAPARRRASMLDSFTFRFVGETRAVSSAQWHAKGASHLWRYNLHYFDDLNAIDAPCRTAWHKEALQDWLAHNSDPYAESWDPYPTSLRVVNLIKWALGGASIDKSLLCSLTTQVRVLNTRLEYHLMGNHLFANAKALVFAGLFFRGAEADEWFAKGMRILLKQTSEQILHDGGHFERSTMYHALALEDMLDLINIMNAFSGTAHAEWLEIIKSWRSLACDMSRWMVTMSHPDGELSLFNDAAFGIAPSQIELKRYVAAILGDEALDLRGRRCAAGTINVRRLSESGYVRADWHDAVLFLDVGPVGPDYLPGHAHADTLSFELSVFGSRVLVNSGTSCYGSGPDRQMERGTAAHNTVVVDGADSSEVWAGFRVARRARPFDLSFAQDAGEVNIACAHDGYRRLKGKPVHRRTWKLRAHHLRIEDSVEGEFRSADAHFHLHPDVRCVVDPSQRSGAITLPSKKAISWIAYGGKVQLAHTNYHPEFGMSIPNRCLILQLSTNAAAIEFSW